VKDDVRGVHPNEAPEHRRDWFAVERRVFDDPMFGGDEFSRREAWLWLIAHAAARPHHARTRAGVIALQRGEVIVASEYLAEKWTWSRKRVRTFLEQLAQTNRIEMGQSNGHRPNVARITNYQRYQDAGRGAAPAEGQWRANGRASGGPVEGQWRASGGPHLYKIQDTDKMMMTTRAHENAKFTADDTSKLMTKPAERPAADTPPAAPATKNIVPDGMMARLIAAAAPIAHDPARAFGISNPAIPAMWLAEGCDADRDVLPTVEAIARKMAGRIRIDSWAYFSRAVAEAKILRLRGLPDVPEVTVAAAAKRAVAVPNWAADRDARAAAAREAIKKYQ
jgi:hypothetical protein